MWSPDSVLFCLTKLLGLELLGQSQNLEDNLVHPQGNIEDKGQLEEEDSLAEATLEQKMERSAAEDPDVVVLEQGKLCPGCLFCSFIMLSPYYDTTHRQIGF